MLKQPKIAFLGSSNMAQSLISGLIESGFNPSDIWGTDRNAKKLNQLKELFQIQTELSNPKAVNLVDVVVLAVEPQDIHLLVTELKETLLSKKPLIISIATDINTQHLEQWLGSHLAIVRAIPNTPALFRAGATGLYANTRVSPEQKNLAESLLRAVGFTAWVDHEHDIDTIAALSGSGPAYFFLMMEALQQGAEQLGLSHATARLLTLQTALGAARMAIENEIDLAALRQQAASPGGSTEQALQILESGGIRSLFKNALETARKRTIEISQKLGKE